MARDSDNEWHLDKKVPLGLLVMIVVQTMTLVYVGTTWKSEIDNRVGNLEKSETTNAPNSTRILILEQQFKFIGTTLERIERKLNKEDRLQ